MRRDCPCRAPRHRIQVVNHLVKISGVPDRYRWKFRTDFLDAEQPGLAGKIRASIAKLVDSQEPPKQGLFLHGTPGTGKTLLASIVLNELMYWRMKRGRFVNLARSLFPRLRQTMSEGSQESGKLFQIQERLATVPYLVIDDLGVQRGTEWEEEILYDLVDARYAEQQFTVVTTNTPLDEIEGISRGRIYSRLKEMCRWLKLEGTDWRCE